METVEHIVETACIEYCLNCKRVSCNVGNCGAYMRFEKTARAQAKAMKPVYDDPESIAAAKRAYMREYRARNAERVREREAAYRERNREKLRAADRKRYAERRKKRDQTGKEALYGGT